MESLILYKKTIISLHISGLRSPFFLRNFFSDNFVVLVQAAALLPPNPRHLSDESESSPDH